MEKNILETSFKVLNVIYYVDPLEKQHYYTMIKIRDKQFKFNDNNKN